MRSETLFDGALLRATLFNPGQRGLFVSFRQRLAEPGHFGDPRPVRSFTNAGMSHLHLQSRWFLRLAVAAIPLPWFAAELGWIVAELGRQPWAIEGVLPTFLASSSLSRGALWTTLAGFTLLYGALAVIEVRLILAAIRHGPSDAEHDQPTPGSLPATPMTA